MKTLTDVLKFLRLADDDGTLSLTSIILLCVIYKFMACPLETEALVALLGAMSFYSGKKLLRSRAVGSEVGKQVAGLGELVTDLSKRTTMLENRANANQVRR